MPAELIVDASVAAKFYFHEEGSREAQAILTSGLVLAAPDLLWIELASVAAKRTRRGLSTREHGRDAVASLGDLIDEFVPATGLAAPAFALAADAGYSAYDATYLALARQRGLRLLTADQRLIRQAEAAGMRDLVQSL
ncbi:MAG TPA: type II toxin-antitoxin system VapC family toxin [Caulobacteraceae bacterium]|nr:type II toxin-antitoxin system VapC family toxin [Caulobacteraceae bacterium]